MHCFPPIIAALHERGLPVPTPVAGCVWRHGLTYQAGLLTERLMGKTGNVLRITLQLLVVITLFVYVVWGVQILWGY